jgi:hypothetical protein
MPERDDLAHLKGEVSVVVAKRMETIKRCIQHMDKVMNVVPGEEATNACVEVLFFLNRELESAAKMLELSAKG